MGSVTVEHSGGLTPNAPDVSLLVPASDVDDPELSIVVPALNEEITIGEFIAWCKQGIAAAGVRAEILIVDSSTDRTAEIAVAGGARVLKTPKRGLGRAYIDALPFIRGRYVLMGDADCTYDFREIAPFVTQFRSGAEFIMGSRFKGSIEDGAMPPLHRYFGTPLTTWILNFMYRTHFSDIHCGMRGITLDGFKRMALASESWEYASEMVLKSVHLDLGTTEVPVRFLKAPEGRTSHLVRGGWTTPWKAGWINLKAMFVFGADFFLTVPGVLFFVLGFVPLCLLAFGPVTIGGVSFSLNTMLLSLLSAVLGVQLLLTGAIAGSLYDAVGKRRRRTLRFLTYTRTTVVAAIVFVVGLVPVIHFALAFAGNGYAFDDSLVGLNHLAVFGMFMMIASALVFVSMLLIHAIDLYVPIKLTKG